MNQIWKNSYSMKIPMSKRIKDDEEIDIGPGPGSYMINDDFKCPKFAHTKGAKTLQKINQNPGPGEYNIENKD